MARPKAEPYTDQEQLVFLAVMKKFLPLGTGQWQKVEKEYNETIQKKSGGKTDRYRTVSSLESLWKKLSNARRPAGSKTPNKIQSKVRVLREMINQKEAWKMLDQPPDFAGPDALSTDDEFGSESEEEESVEEVVPSQTEKRARDDDDKEATSSVKRNRKNADV